MTVTSKFFTLKQISPTDVPDIANLFASENDANLTPCTNAEIANWCDNSAGILARDHNGEAAAACFWSLEHFPVCGGSRALYDVAECVYFHHALCRRRDRTLHLFRKTGQATIALSVQALDGLYPPGIACAFYDDKPALRAHQKAGMRIIIPQDDYVIECVKLLRAVDTKAWSKKSALGIDRPHAIEVLDNAEILGIADWITLALDNPVKDPETGLIVSMIDPSNGRSNLRREMRDIAARKPAALARLGLPRKKCRAA